MYTVTSEIYKETNFQPQKSAGDKVISKFKFVYPIEARNDDGQPQRATVDKDGDLLVTRRPTEVGGIIKIEHSVATELQLVGLQVWRGALLLADYFFHCREEIKGKKVLELGAGVGLTSIAASIYARHVVCTDVDRGGLLDLIRANIAQNRRVLRGKVDVLEFDFMQKKGQYSPALLDAIRTSDIVVAADVIYDESLTDAFINVIDNIFSLQADEMPRQKTIYVALEKRFVFTLSELDAVAPMYEHFIQCTMNKPWHFEYVPIDFPQYFEYERCKHLVLLKLTCSKN